MKRKSRMAFGLVLTLSLAPVCKAETIPFEAQSQVSWRDGDPSLYEGEWISTGLGYEVYLPLAWEKEELTAQEQESGILLRYVEEENGGNVTVAYGELPKDAATIESIYEELFQEEEYPYVTYLLVNSIQAVGFDEKEGVSGISFLDSHGNMVLIAVAPTFEESDKATALNILMSIRPEA